MTNKAVVTPKFDRSVLDGPWVRDEQDAIEYPLGYIAPASGWPEPHLDEPRKKEEVTPFPGSPRMLFDNQLLTYKQTARYLGISEPYLRRLKAKGKIPFVPMGGRGVRFRVASLNSWIEKREVK